MQEVVATETKRMEQVMENTHLDEGNKIWSTTLHRDIGSTKTAA
jgi:hypothetical protein